MTLFEIQDYSEAVHPVIYLFISDASGSGPLSALPSTPCLGLLGYTALRVSYIVQYDVV